MKTIETISQTKTQWNNVSLDDYEKHMQHQTVGQLQMLNSLTKKFLDIYQPKDLLILGVAGGNGLEHVNPLTTHEIIGIDINELYLEIVSTRFKGTLPQLKLIRCNLDETTQSFIKADFIWAALFLEYINLENCIEFLKNNLNPLGRVIITIQSNNGKGAVSDTGIEGVKILSEQFKKVDKTLLIEKMLVNNFMLISEEENFLPNGKSFSTIVFQG